MRAAVYVVGLFALFGVAQSQNPDVWFLAFAIAPQFFSFLDLRLAMGLGIALNFLAAGLLGDRYPGVGNRSVRDRGGRRPLLPVLQCLGITDHQPERGACRDHRPARGHQDRAGGRAARGRPAGRAAAARRGYPRHTGAGLYQHPHADPGGTGRPGRLASSRRPGIPVPPRGADGQGEPDRGASPGGRPGPCAARRRTAARRAAQAVAGTGSGRSFALSGTPRPLPMATEVVLLRVCQEALANVRKHAGAHAATVRLDYDPDAIRLEVSDDGAEFPAPGPGQRRLRPARDADPGRRGGRHAERAQRARRGHRRQRDGAGVTAIRVLLADDHPVVREGLRGMLAAEPDIEVVGRGRIRSRGGGARRAATAGRDPDGPAHAPGGDGWGGHPAPGRDPRSWC